MYGAYLASKWVGAIFIPRHAINYTFGNKMNDGIDPPAKVPPIKYINVKGREEHEAILRDTHKMHSLGLDPFYEKVVYVQRWGSWLDGCVDYSGEI
jgi:hypothetical protein